MKRYIYLLKLALIEACVVIKDARTEFPVLFCSRIIALSCIRIPGVSDVVYEALLALQPPVSLSLPDYRYDVFNVDEEEYAPVLQTKLSSPLPGAKDSEDEFELEGSLPKSHTMSFFPDTQSSFPSPSFDGGWSDDSYSDSTEDSDFTEVSATSESASLTDSASTEASEEGEEEGEEESESDTSQESEAPLHPDEDYHCARIRPRSRVVILQAPNPPTFEFTFDTEENADADMLPLGGEKTGKDVLDGFFGTHSSISPTTPLGPPEEELPPLRVIDYAVLVDRYCRECIYNKELQRRREEFIFAYPSFFFWCTLPDRGLALEPVGWWKERWRPLSSVMRRLATHDGFLFTLVRCWLDLVDDYRAYRGAGARANRPSHAEVLFPCIPGYFVMLRALLPNLQASLIHQYRCGVLRSRAYVSNYAFNTAGLKARWVCSPSLTPSESLLVDSAMLDLSPPTRPLTRRLVQLLFSQCNAYVVNDVLTCRFLLPASVVGFFYLETWADAIRSRCIAQVLQLRPIASLSDVPAQRAIDA